MTERKQFDNAKDALAFILAGNATITLVSKKTGARFTYRIRKPDGPEHGSAEAAKHGKPIRFVALLNGPDNENAFQYLGCIFLDTLKYVHGRKSKVGSDAPSAKAFAWAFNQLNATFRHSGGDIPAELEIWHEGKCGRCGRKLTVPESIDRGIGPECATKGGY